eukprot:COSAG02_NODE_12421_length_1548_cov_1.522429_3_plen_25_part_01
MSASTVALVPGEAQRLSFEDKSQRP